MSYSNADSDRSQKTNASSCLIPPTVLPKYFNVPFAIQHGYFRCIRYLLELSYDPNERDNQLRTPLILCSYIENDQWSLTIAQNLLEKGAKIALEDHARRNAMHHACALQRIHLVQLYLSCLEFNIQSKDCEGNTCLHYAAITGNYDIAELLIRTSDKIGVHLDQYANREGFSAAAIALKYGHIECANQITHRDWDEFFVVPRPLSIYETHSTTNENHTQLTTTTTTTTSSSKTKNKRNSTDASEIKNDIRPTTLSFGLLKIIFNENDSGYSTRLAQVYKDGKNFHNRRRSKNRKKNVSKSKPENVHYSSTEALVNELQSSTIDEESKLNNNDRDSPRIQLLMQQQFSNRENNLSNDNVKSKTSIPTIYRQISYSTLNQYEPIISPRIQRPRTAAVTSVNAVGAPSRLSSIKTPIRSTPKKFHKKSSTVNRPNSASLQHSTLVSETSTYSQTLYEGRPVSAVLQNHYRYQPVQRTVDSSCSIREAKGATSRYNHPEKLFGIKPEELFAPNEHQPKIIDHNQKNENTRLKRSQRQNNHVWQQDIDKLVDLLNIHHSSNYRPSVTSSSAAAHVAIQIDAANDLLSNGKSRRISISKSPSNLRPQNISKQSTLASLNIPRRNSITARQPIKLTNA